MIAENWKVHWEDEKWTDRIDVFTINGSKFTSDRDVDIKGNFSGDGKITWHIRADFFTYWKKLGALIIIIILKIDHKGIF